MASIHPELAEITIKAAQWLVDTHEPLDWTLLPLLSERFGLSKLQAVQALFEAVCAKTETAGGLTREQALSDIMFTARELLRHIEPEGRA